MRAPAVVLAALPVVCVLCLSPAADAAAPIQFPKKVRQEWELWGRAFQAAANEDGRITSRGVLDLFREHYKLIHNTIPGHESHDHITDEDAELFKAEASAFVAFVTRDGGIDEVNFTWQEFKRHMYDFMDAKADEAARMRASAAAVAA